VGRRPSPDPGAALIVTDGGGDQQKPLIWCNHDSMFSHRLDWNLRPNPIASMLAGVRRSGRGILDLTESNPTLAGFSYPADEILSAFQNPRMLFYEPSPRGLRQAREAVAAAHGVEPDRILLTTSTSESYTWLFKLLADPGDEILVPRPSYPLFEFLAGLESVRVRQYPLACHEGWWIDWASLESQVTDRTRAILVVNPNNPTGSYLKRHELYRLTALCAAQGLAIISDEVFADFAHASDESRATSLAGVTGALTFCLSGLSKVAGLPQMKLGWIIAGGPGSREAMERMELIADTYLSVSTPIQLAAPTLLDLRHELRKQIHRRVLDNLAFLRANHHPAHDLLEPEGGWYAVLRVPRTGSEQEWVMGLLEREGVLVQPGYFYDFDSEAWLILSLLTHPAVFQEGARRIAAFSYN